MEEWQKKFITKNLPELITLTSFNVKVKAELQAKNILTQVDVEQLDAENFLQGKSAASSNYYHCLMTRVGAYNLLAKILEENQQTGAVRILKDGMRKFGFPKEWQVFNNVKINVQGKTVKFKEFFATEKLELAQQIFRDTIPDQYDTFAKKEQTFVLATSSIPPQPPLYIPRFLSNRIEVDQTIFKTDCPDVFVFKNNISRHQLSEIVTPHSTDTSTSQLTKITCRFIHLDEINDWYELKKTAKVPIHLINSDANQQIYLLEDTTAALEILSRIGSQKQRTYLSEDEFVQQQLSEKVSSVCICDTPGMGKTYLLANIARVMLTHCTGTIVVFIQLSTFVAEICLSSTNTTKEEDAALLKVFKYASSFPQHADLLLRLVEAELIQVEIFFDGFDEIPSEQVECIQQIFLSITSELQNVRIYITSRPHMRHELEKSLGVIAYDILPLNLQNQVDYLVQFWSPSVSEVDLTSLESYARKCLEEINRTLTKNDKEIAGIPLLCRLIAEVYANKVNFYSTTGTKDLDFPVKIAAMYQTFVEQRFKNSVQNEYEIKKVKLVHIWHALKLLFPTEGFHDSEIFTEVHQMLESSEVLNAGIIELQSNTKLEFIHRTFAEYFAAEYFSEKILSTAVKPKAFLHKIFNSNDETAKMFSIILNFPVDTDFSELNRITFLHAVIVSFVDFSFNEVGIPGQIIGRIASFCASISTKKFLSILCSCCNQNFSNLFSVLTKAVTKWNWFQKKKYFTTENCFYLLSVCIIVSTSQMFRSCIQLLTEELRLDLEIICIYDRERTLLHRAAKAANYEAVEYLVSRVSLELPSVLRSCVAYSNDDSLDKIKRRENILHLLLNKNPTLIQETMDILVAPKIHVALYKMLVKLGANLTAGNEFGENCVISAAEYMLSSDFHELVLFLLNECEAEYLFLDDVKCRHPMPYIIKKVKLLPETLELLLNIPRVDINKKNEGDEKLLFSAVVGNNVSNFQLLINRGLDLKARGKENRSLLHEAAYCGKLEVTHYLLSLGMDPNSRDKYERTPLHYAAINNQLEVAESLIENGANVHAKNIRGQTPLHLHLACKDYENKSIKMIMYLITKGAEINDRDNDGNTPLHLCIRPDNKDCLLEMGADIHAKNKKGETPAQKTPWLWK